MGWIGAEGGREGGREEAEIVDPGEIEPEVGGGDSLPSAEDTPFRCGASPPLTMPGINDCGYCEACAESRMSSRDGCLGGSCCAKRPLWTGMRGEDATGCGAGGSGLEEDAGEGIRLFGGLCRWY